MGWSRAYFNYTPCRVSLGGRHHRLWPFILAVTPLIGLILGRLSGLLKGGEYLDEKRHLGYLSLSKNHKDLDDTLPKTTEASFSSPDYL